MFWIFSTKQLSGHQELQSRFDQENISNHLFKNFFDFTGGCNLLRNIYGCLILFAEKGMIIIFEKKL